jgi:hypothetical protein
MPDLSLTAARALRALLAAAIVAILAGILWATDRLKLAGMWTLVAGPFVVLVIVSAATPRTRWFAAGTIALAAIGLLLAR